MPTTPNGKHPRIAQWLATAAEKNHRVRVDSDGKSWTIFDGKTLEHAFLPFPGLSEYRFAVLGFSKGAILDCAIQHGGATMWFGFSFARGQYLAPSWGLRYEGKGLRHVMNLSASTSSMGSLNGALFIRGDESLLLRVHDIWGSMFLRSDRTDPANFPRAASLVREGIKHYRVIHAAMGLGPLPARFLKAEEKVKAPFAIESKDDGA